MNPEHRRCRAVLTHLASPQHAGPPPLISTPAAALDAAEPAAPPMRPLSAAQIAQFAEMGYLVLNIDELEPELHARIYEYARINQKGSVFTPGQISETTAAQEALESEPELTPEQRLQFRNDFAAVSTSPTILGAMHSLLGPDFVGFVDDVQGGRIKPTVVGKEDGVLDGRFV